MLRLFRSPRAPIVAAAPPSRSPVALPPLTIAGRVVPVALVRNARARHLTLRADAVAGEVRLTLPPRTKLGEATAFLATQHAWLAARVVGWPRPLPFVAGAAIPFEGGTLTLDWSPAHRRGVARDGDRLRVGGEASTLPGRVTRWLRAQALATLTRETHALAATHGLTVARVAVRDPAARWGSCSTARGRIGYSWRLILAPPDVRRSVVAHEVAHLVHPNHGPAFWTLAAALGDGDPAPHRRWLARHGAGLHWVGRN